MAVFIVNQRLRSARTFRRSRHLDGLTEAEIISRYRFSERGIEFLEDLLEEHLRSDTKRNQAVTVREQILITLRYYASGSFFEVVGDTLGFNKGTVSRVVARVTEAIIHHFHEFICWPEEKAEKERIKEGFLDVGGFHNAIGAIDGTHIRIIGPAQDEASYVNRKGFHSVSVQAVCDHEGKFTSLNASWPGSCHDSHVFRTSGLCQRLERDNQRLSDGILLGDSGYPCRPFLMTPFLIASTPGEQAYQQAHTRTRVTIERAFGRLKRRFHVLHSEVRLAPLKVCKIVTACAILHNIAIMLKDDLLNDGDDEVDDNDDTDANGEDFRNAAYDRHDGKAVRRHIVEQYF